jgi:DNA methylase
MQQTNLFLDAEQPTENLTASTFFDNLSLPIHRWFRYSAGFSAVWVRNLIEREKKNGHKNVLDPFAGSGTVLLEAEHCGVDSMGVESHPFVWRVANAKLHWHTNYKEFRKYALALLKQAQGQRAQIDFYPKLIGKCFHPEALVRLDALRRAWTSTADGSAYSELTWLALASILRECSTAGTAPWQYILPRKKKTKVVDPYAA